MNHDLVDLAKVVRAGVNFTVTREILRTTAVIDARADNGSSVRSNFATLGRFCNEPSRSAGVEFKAWRDVV